MSNHFIKPILYFIPLAILQFTVIPLISISNIVPNLVFVLIAFYTLRYGQFFGTILGFILGFLFDLISGGLLGAFMFSFTLSAFLVGYFYNENKIEFNTTSFFFLLIVFICGSVNSFVYSAISNTNTNVGFFSLILEEGLLPGIYTALLGLPIVIIYFKKGMQ